MSSGDGKGGSGRAQMGELLASLPEIEHKKEKAASKLEETALETQLLSLADVTIEKETEVLKDVLSAARKL
jgi:hypothetical protein